MASLNQSTPSYHLKFLRCALCAHDFELKNPLYHPLTLPKSGLTMCRQCVGIIRDETKCPHNHGSVGMNYTSIDELPTNYPLLLLLCDESELPQDRQIRHRHYGFYNNLDHEEKKAFNATEEFYYQLSKKIKTNINDGNNQSMFNPSMITKIFNLLNRQYLSKESGLIIIKSIKSLGEEICSNLLLHNKAHQVTTNEDGTLKILLARMKQYQYYDDIISDVQKLSDIVEPMDDQKIFKKIWNWSELNTALYAIVRIVQYFIKSETASHSH